MDSAQAIVSLTLDDDPLTSDEPMVPTSYRDPLKEQEVLCDHVHESMLRKTGIIVQFSNSNAAGATSMIAVGHPLQELLAQVKRTGADFVIVGSHGHGVLGVLLLGSVAEGMVRKATVPTLIVPAAPEPT